MSFKIKICWSSGATAEYSGESSKEQFLTSFFGHCDRLPDGVTVVDIEDKVVEPEKPVVKSTVKPTADPAAKPVEKKDVK